jgi:hypothetical protein
MCWENQLSDSEKAEALADSTQADYTGKQAVTKMANEVMHA